MTSPGHSGVDAWVAAHLDQVVAHLRLDYTAEANATDQTGTLSAVSWDGGAAAGTIDGEGGVDYDGTAGNAANFADVARLDDIRGAFIVVDADDLTGFQYLISRDNGSRDWQFRLNGDQLEFLNDPGGTSYTQTVDAGDAIGTGATHTLGFWHDGTNLNLYVDGVAVDSDARAAIAGNTSDLAIGHNYGPAPGDGLNGTYAACVLLDTEATANSIPDLHEAWTTGIGGVSDYLALVDGQGATSFWNPKGAESSAYTWLDLIGSDDMDMTGGSSAAISGSGPLGDDNGIALTSGGTEGIVGTTTNYDSAQSWTISFWIRASSLSGNQALASFETSGTEYVYIIHRDDRGGLVAQIQDGGSSVYIDPGSVALDDSAWHHVALVRDYSATAADDDWTLYVDGAVELATTASTLGITPADTGGSAQLAFGNRVAVDIGPTGDVALPMFAEGVAMTDAQISAQVFDGEGSANPTLAAATSAASGSITEDITGTTNVTLADVDSDASGLQGTFGDGDVDLADATSTATGVLGFIGSATETLAAATSTAVGEYTDEAIRLDSIDASSEPDGGLVSVLVDTEVVPTELVLSSIDASSTPMGVQSVIADDSFPYRTYQ